MGNVISAAKAYAGYGWRPVPLTSPRSNHKSAGKRPVRSGWQRRPMPTEDEIEQLFAGEANVGIALGKESGGLYDVDLDCPEAIALADALLPKTPLESGRASAKRSHRWYLTPEDKPTVQWEAEGMGVLVELRGTGGQTVAPPSVHAKSKETVAWHAKGAPARVAYPELHLAVSRLAAASLLVNKGWDRKHALEWVKFPDPDTCDVTEARTWLMAPEKEPRRVEPPSTSTEEVLRLAHCADVLRMLGIADTSPRTDCPIKQHESSGSFTHDGEKYYCHACKSGGNAIHLVSAVRNTTYLAARDWISERVGLPTFEEARAQRRSASVASPEPRHEPQTENARNQSTTLESVLEATLDVHARAARGDLGKRIFVGLRGFDGYTRGLRPGQLTLLGARPSVGKSALSTRMLLGAASEGFNVGMISLEVCEEELGASLIAIHGGIWRAHVEDGGEPERVAQAAEEIRNLPGSIRFLCPTRAPTPTALVGMLYEMHEESELDLVVVDYIQRVATSAAMSKVQALEALSIATCEFAKTTGCHVLAAAQLNRESEHRGKNVDPRMSDLKGSGQFEQDAHNVLLLHRPNKGSNSLEKPDSIAWLIVAKSRNGPTGSVRLAWDGPTVTFSDGRHE